MNCCCSQFHDIVSLSSALQGSPPDVEKRGGDHDEPLRPSTYFKHSPDIPHSRRCLLFMCPLAARLFRSRPAPIHAELDDDDEDLVIADSPKHVPPKKQLQFGVSTPPVEKRVTISPSPPVYGPSSGRASSPDDSLKPSPPSVSQPDSGRDTESKQGMAHQQSTDSIVNVKDDGKAGLDQGKGKGGSVDTDDSDSDVGEFFVP